jgi:predicted PurR-regulated permease PerM
MGPDGRDRRLIVWGVSALFGAGLLLWVLYQLRAVLIVLYISTLLAIGLNPAVQWIERRRFGRRARRLPRWVAVLVLYIALLTGLTVLVGLMVPPIAAQVSALGQHLPEYFDQFQKFLVKRGLLAPRWTWADIVKNIESPGVAVANVLGAVQGVLGAIGTIVTILILPYYLLVDAEVLHRGMLQFVPPGNRERVGRVTQNLAVKVGAWLTGQVFLCFVIGTAVSIVLGALGVPFFYVLGLIAAVGEAVPVIGPIISAVPAVLMGATVSIKTAVFVAIFFWGVQSIENNFLVPRVMRRQVGLSTVTVLVALLAGSTLLGIVGALLAVPTAAILQVLAQEFLSQDEVPAQKEGRA